MIIMPVSRMRKLRRSKVMDLRKAAWLRSNGAAISGQVLNPQADLQPCQLPSVSLALACR